MGFKLTWVSIKGKEREVLFRHLGVQPDGARITNVSEETVSRPLKTEPILSWR